MAFLARRESDPKTLSEYPRHRALTLRDEIDRVFDDFFSLGFPGWPSRKHGSTMREFVPTIDLSETKSEIRVSAELPGLTEHDVHVDLDDEVLTISGERHEEKKAVEGDRQHWREIHYGSFRRDIALPCRVDTSRAKATFKNGMLSVVVPKTPDESARRRTIEISRG